jgi:hypothetical protein
VRSLKHISNKLLKVRITGGALGAIAVGGLIVATNFAMMDDLLLRWEQADQANLTKQSESARATTLAKPETVRLLASVAKVKDAFTSAGYELDAVRRGTVAVPRVHLASLPYDLPQMRQAQDRKAVFLRYMLPYVLEANNRVRQQHVRLLSLRPKIDKVHPVSRKKATPHLASGRQKITRAWCRSNGKPDRHTKFGRSRA